MHTPTQTNKQTNTNERTNAGRKRRVQTPGAQESQHHPTPLPLHPNVLPPRRGQGSLHLSHRRRGRRMSLAARLPRRVRERVDIGEYSAELEFGSFTEEDDSE